MDNSLPTPAFYLQATPRQTGAVAVFHFYASEERLAQDLDLGLKNGTGHAKTLVNGEIRYGKLLGSQGEELDQVLLAKPRPGLRVLTPHGGQDICRRLSLHFQSLYWQELDQVLASPTPASPVVLDQLVNPDLAACQTPGQVALVLGEQETGLPVDPLWRRLRLESHCLAICGAPNAGKSSLLNRLAGFPRALVHPEPGATRDPVEEELSLADFSVQASDLPGLGSTPLPAFLQAEVEKRLKAALVVALVVDQSCPWEGETAAAAGLVRDILAGGGKEPAKILVALNKSDLPPGLSGEPWQELFPSAKVIRLSSRPEDPDPSPLFAQAFHQLVLDAYQPLPPGFI
ncbi:MAG: 50S ribosome-binding GTPase [Planctomycetota bacterium]|nr:50S ribosome-binding GTPase [Planctomycetota bacterium]